MRIRLTKQGSEVVPTRAELGRVRGVVLVDGDGTAIFPPVLLEGIVPPPDAMQFRVTLDFEIAEDE